MFIDSFWCRPTATVSNIYPKLISALSLLVVLSGTANAGPINLALASNGSVATQSSTLSSLGNDGQLQVASRAIDGDRNGDFFSGRITHTDIEFQPWWEVTFGGGAGTVNEINIWNRTDCCTERLSDFNVFLSRGGNVVWSALGNAYNPNPLTSFFVPGIIGDTVRIQLNGTNYLSLAEVEVFANAVPEPTSIALVLCGIGLVGGFHLRRVRVRSNRENPLSAGCGLG
jgi:hypothetical protein